MNKEECDNRVFLNAKNFSFPFYNVQIFITSVHFCNEKFKYGKTYSISFSPKGLERVLFYFKNTKSVNVIHGQLGNITYIQESVEKLLISWQRLMLSGVLWFQETVTSNSMLAKNEAPESAACPASPAQPCVYLCPWVLIWRLSFAFLSCIKGIIIGPSPQA